MGCKYNADKSKVRVYYTQRSSYTLGFPPLEIIYEYDRDQASTQFFIPGCLMSDDGSTLIIKKTVQATPYSLV